METLVSGTLTLEAGESGLLGPGLYDECLSPPVALRAIRRKGLLRRPSRQSEGLGLRPNSLFAVTFHNYCSLLYSTLGMH